MSDLNYTDIESLVASKEVKGSTVHVTFRCDETGAEANSSASIERGTGMKAEAARSAKTNIWYSIRRSVLGTISDLFGRGAAGRVARDVANTGMKNAQSSTQHGKAEVQAAVVKAFDGVKNQFVCDQTTGRWKGATAAEESAEESKQKETQAA